MVRVLRNSLPYALGISLTALLGCSGGSGGPTSSPLPENPAAPQVDTPAPAADTTVERFDSGGSALFLAQGTIDWNDGSISMEPMTIRDGQLTPVANDRRTIDASPFLTADPCPDCFRITGLGLDPSGNVLADFSLKHPFQDRTKRADLDVFDPIAIFYSAGTKTFDKLDPIDEDGDGGADGRPQGNTNLIAAPSGFTNRHDTLIESLFPSRNYTGNINPYVSFFTENDYSPTGIGSDIAWHKFPMGTAVDTKRVTFIRPTTPPPFTFDFVVALSVSYGVSATYLNTLEDPTALGARLNPVYFNPEFNMKEAYEVTTNPGAGLEAGVPTSTTLVSVQVKDWQAGATVDPGYPNFPNYTNRTGLKSRSDVSSVKLTVPGVSQTLYSKLRSEKAGGDGTSTNPYRFEFTLTNDLLALPGVYTGLVAVVDEYLVDGQSLLGYTPTEIQRDFVTYQMVKVAVNTPACLTPIAVAEADKTEAASGEDISFISSNSSAPGSTITEYAWDFDGVDPPEFVSANPDPVTYSFTNDTGADIQATGTLKVTNACGAFHLDTVQVTINSDQPPVACGAADPSPAASGQSIELDATCSTDPDGDSLLLEWDFDWDGVPANFDIDATGAIANTSYCNTTNGTITARPAVRATSNGSSDIQEVPITINGNRAPTAVIDATPNPVFSGVQVDLSSTGSADPDTDCGGDSLSAFEWDFDYDGSNFTIDASGPSANTTYDNPGASNITKIAALRVRDSRGATSAVVTESITVQPAPACTKPTARAGVSTTSQISGLPIDFFANLSTPNAGEFTKYSWDWDVFDAEAPVEFAAAGGFLPTQSHTYLWAGPGNKTFRARLTVYTSDTCFDGTGPGPDCSGDPDQCDINITVTPNTPPIAACDVNSNPVTAGCIVNFDEAGSTDPDPTGSIIKYQWDWDDRNGVNWVTPDFEATTQGQASHAYPGAAIGSFKATLRVIDNNGTFGFCEIDMTVNANQTPTAVADATPNPVQYTNIPVDLIDSASTDPDACGGVTYVWDFDDSDGVILDPLDANVDYVGTVADGATVTYNNPGPGDVVKTATLRIIDGGGLTADDSVAITVGPPLPVPVITWQEVKDANAVDATYIYNPLSMKDYDDVEDAVDAGAPWDFTNRSLWPERAAADKFSTYGTTADYPNVDIPNATIINYAQTSVDADNYEGRHFFTGNLVQIWGLSSGDGCDLQLTDPVEVQYPQTVGTFWNMSGFGQLACDETFDIVLQIVVQHAQSGLTTTTNGTFNCVVEEAIVTQEYQIEGTPVLSATQREFTWVSDEGYIVAQWTESFDGGEPSGNMLGKELISFNLP